MSSFGIKLQLCCNTPGLPIDVSRIRVDEIQNSSLSHLFRGLCQRPKHLSSLFSCQTAEWSTVNVSLEDEHLKHSKYDFLLSATAVICSVLVWIFGLTQLLLCQNRTSICKDEKWNKSSHIHFFLLKVTHKLKYEIVDASFPLCWIQG